MEKFELYNKKNGFALEDDLKDGVLILNAFPSDLGGVEVETAACVSIAVITPEDILNKDELSYEFVAEDVIKDLEEHILNEGSKAGIDLTDKCFVRQYENGELCPLRDAISAPCSNSIKWALKENLEEFYERTMIQKRSMAMDKMILEETDNITFDLNKIKEVASIKMGDTVIASFTGKDYRKIENEKTSTDEVVKMIEDKINKDGEYEFMRGHGFRLDRAAVENMKSILRDGFDRADEKYVEAEIVDMDNSGHDVRGLASINGHLVNFYMDGNALDFETHIDDTVSADEYRKTEAFLDRCESDISSQLYIAIKKNQEKTMELTKEQKGLTK